MKKVLLVFVLSALAPMASAAGCFHFSNGMSSYFASSVSSDGLYIYATNSVSGTDSMTATPPCVMPPIQSLHHTATVAPTIRSNSGRTTTAYNSHADCQSCYLSVSGVASMDVATDTSWTLEGDAQTICSSAGLVYSGTSSGFISLHHSNYKFWDSLGSDCQFLLSCPNPPNTNAVCGQPAGVVISWLSKGNECTFTYLHDIRFSIDGKCFPIGKAVPSNSAIPCD